MKFSLLSLGLLASSILAAPTPTADEVADAALIVKRASISDVCSLFFPSSLPNLIHVI